MTAVIDDADGGDHDDGDPDLLQHVEAQRRAAIEQDVAGAEQQDDLVQRRIRLDVDQPERLRADRDPGDQKHRDVGNPDLLRHQAGERADRQNEPARQQRVLGDLDGGGGFQAVSLDRDEVSSALVQRLQPGADFAGGDIGLRQQLAHGEEAVELAGKVPVGHGHAGFLQPLRRIRRLRRAADRRRRSAHRPAAGRPAFSARAGEARQSSMSAAPLR